MDPGAPGDLIMQNKANFRNDKMNTTFFLTKDYENETAFRLHENKPNQTQFEALPYLPKEREEKNRSGRLLINPMLPLYKPGNDQYYIRDICRCSSMVEHSFRKAGVEGPTPSIGCGFGCERTPSN